MPPGPKVPQGVGPSEFHGAMAHLYRGEMHRMTVWRQRLDITSNWAIILTTALTTFTLGAVEVPHYTLLLGLALIGISILIEGRRYRHLHHSKWRLYLLERGFFGELLSPPSAEAAEIDWRRLLSRDLRHTHFALSWLMAVRVRLRRNYLLLLYFVTGVWIVKLFIHPSGATTESFVSRARTLTEFYERLAVGDFIAPWFVALTAVAFIVVATVLALTCPESEELEDFGRHYGRVERRRWMTPPPEETSAERDLTIR